MMFGTFKNLSSVRSTLCTCHCYAFGIRLMNVMQCRWIHSKFSHFVVRFIGNALDSNYHRIYEKLSKNQNKTKMYTNKSLLKCRKPIVSDFFFFFWKRKFYSSIHFIHFMFAFNYVDSFVKGTFECSHAKTRCMY